MKTLKLSISDLTAQAAVLDLDEPIHVRDFILDEMSRSRDCPLERFSRPLTFRHYLDLLSITKLDHRSSQEVLKGNLRVGALQDE